MSERFGQVARKMVTLAHIIHDLEEDHGLAAYGRLEEDGRLGFILRDGDADPHESEHYDYMYCAVSISAPDNKESFLQGQVAIATLAEIWEEHHKENGQ